LANLNRIILVGRLTADPEGRSTADGTAVTKFRLAVDRPVSGVKREDNIDLIDVVTWQRLAEVCAQYLKKGRLVLVEGRIQNRSFEDQAGQRRWVTEVVARNMTMLEGHESRVASHESSVASGPETRDPGPVTDEELIDDSGLESDLPF
jgi:single-strand DNA-binding protein